MEENEVVTETTENVASQEPTAEGVVETPSFYTADELKAITPTNIDLDRVAPEARPIVENAIRDYKALETDYTKKSQELAELKKAPSEPELFFPNDQRKETVFKDYLKTPVKILSDINNEIAKLEAVLPDDGIDEYRAARQNIAYWNGIKDEFSAKRIEVIEHKRDQEISEAKINAELGEEAHALFDYGRSLGFSDKDIKSKPELRASVKHLYELANAGKTAHKKEVKPTPHKAATPSGQSGTDAPPAVDTSKMTDAEWYEYDKKQRIEKLKKKLGG
jgi:hypothetical protein